MRKERTDDKGRILLTGESQIANGSYCYRYYGEDGKRKSVSSWKLLPGDIGPDGSEDQECLRDIENRLIQIGRKSTRTVPQKEPCTFDELWKLYLSMKCEIAERTLVSYVYLYNHHLKKPLGRRLVTQIKYSDLRRLYIDKITEGLNISSLSNIHNIISPVLQLAVKEGYIPINPAEGLLGEFQRRKDWNVNHRQALTEKQQNTLVEFASSSYEFKGFMPMLTVFLGTGMRVGELIGLRWDDVDFEENLISVNHTLNYSISLNGKCEYYITVPKTKTGAREIPMMQDVRTTLWELYERRYDFNAQNQVQIDGYTNFVFRDLYGSVYSSAKVNARLKGLVRAYNKAETEKAEQEKREPVLLPEITCHHLRHTFCTRLCENGINIKSIQQLMGHSHAETTMRIYMQATASKNREEIASLDGKLRIR